MTITIEYCTLWNYEPRAVSLAAEIRSKYPKANVELIPSGKGRFEVVHDGTAIFEKSRLDRHARPGEILGLLAQRATTKG